MFFCRTMALGRVVSMPYTAQGAVVSTHLPFLFFDGLKNDGDLAAPQGRSYVSPGQSVAPPWVGMTFE